MVRSVSLFETVRSSADLGSSQAPTLARRQTPINFEEPRIPPGRGAVRGPMGLLKDESLEAQRHWPAAARARSRDALVQEVLNVARHEGNPAVEQIRTVLYLEQYDEDGYS